MLTTHRFLVAMGLLALPVVCGCAGGDHADDIDSGDLVDVDARNGDAGVPSDAPLDASGPRDADPADPDADPDADAGSSCDPGSECPRPEETCMTDSERCVCEVGAGSYWTCEPLECPVDPSPGDTCTTPGLRCDTGFEDSGIQCVEPESVWVRCSQIRWDGTGPRLWCPPEPPMEGSPCCADDFGGGVPDECPYGDSAFRCLSFHWVRIAP